MKVGDLVKYKGHPHIGLVTKLENHRVHFVGFTGWHTWTHRVNVEVISASR